jgi:hypothetical protein
VELKDRYRLYQRENGVFYWQENGTKKQGSLRTKDRREALKLVNAKNESHREPTLNLSIARAYLAAHDPSMSKRTWREVMHEMERHGIDATRERCARTMCSRGYDPIRDKPLVQTTAADLLAVVHANGNSIAHYLRRLHNLAVDLGWLPWPVLTKRSWPKKLSKRRRAIASDEHALIVASEKNPQKRAYYQFLYETGAAQSDAAEITVESIDWQNMLLVYRRKKLGPDSEPARLSIGKTLRQLLETLPKTGPLFPTNPRNLLRAGQHIPPARRPAHKGSHRGREAPRQERGGARARINLKMAGVVGFVRAKLKRRSAAGESRRSWRVHELPSRLVRETRRNQEREVMERGWASTAGRRRPSRPTVEWPLHRRSRCPSRLPLCRCGRR